MTMPKTNLATASTGLTVRAGEAERAAAIDRFEALRLQHRQRLSLPPFLFTLGTAMAHAVGGSSWAAGVTAAGVAAVVGAAGSLMLAPRLRADMHAAERALAQWEEPMPKHGS